MQKCRINYFCKSVPLSSLKTFKEIKISPIQLTLQLFGDAVGGFVIVFDPFSTLGVLNGHSSHTCMKECDIYTQALQIIEAGSLSLSLTCNCSSQFLHQLDGSFHCASSLYPLVH